MATGKQLKYDYNPQSDELNMSFGEARPSIAREMGEEFFVQLDPETQEVVGFTILGFSKRITAKNHSLNQFSVPIKLQGQLQLAN